MKTTQIFTTCNPIVKTKTQDQASAWTHIQKESSSSRCCYDTEFRWGCAKVNMTQNSEIVLHKSQQS